LKKLALILFSVFYLASSSGLALNLHYCGGKLKSIGINQYKEEACCGKKMKSKGCCDNKTTFIKAFDQQTSGSHQFIVKPTTPIFEIGLISPIIYKSPVIELRSGIRTKAPPEYSNTPTFLSIRSIRI